MRLLEYRVSRPVPCLLAIVLLSLCGRAASAQFETSLSPSIGDPISVSLYSESQLTGPSTSLLPQGTSLVLPSLKTGISDPLGFLIETGAMSPYLPGGGMVGSYADTQVLSGTLNDPVLAVRFGGEYRNNRLLMAGAAAANTPSGRMSASGSSFGGSSGVRSGRPGGSDRGEGSLRPFAAGSSALAAQTVAAQGGFVDPNALVSAARSNPSEAAEYASGGTGGGTGGMGMSANPAGSFGNSALAASSDLDATTAVGPGASSEGMLVAPAGVALGLVTDEGADAMPFGAAPGHTYPLFTVAGPSTTGFEDSTMGTAGQAESFEKPDISPLLWGPASSEDRDLAGMTDETTEYLHPSLRVTLLHPNKAPAQSIQQIERSMRKQALANNSRSEMPNAFDRRAAIRAYERGLASGRNMTPSRPSSVRLSTGGTNGR